LVLVPTLRIEAPVLAPILLYSLGMLSSPLLLI